MKDSDQYFRLIFEKTADALLLLDPEAGQFIDCNQAAADMLHFADKSDMIPLQPAELSPQRQPDGRLSAEKAEDMIATALRKGSHRFEWIHCSVNRDDFPVEVLLTPFLIREKQLIIVTWRDITERKHLEAALSLERQQLQTLIQTLPDLIWLKDADGVYLTCNPRFERFFGAKAADIIGKTDYDFVDRELADFFRKHDRAAMEKGGPSVNEEQVTFADDGHSEILETTKTPMFDAAGHLIGVLGIGHNITKRKHLEAELLQRAHVDYLTGVSNRRHFMEQAEQERSRALRYGKSLSIFLLDIDYFKRINDTYGHQVGDAVLVKLAKVCRETLRDVETVGRMGGEEFAILLPETDKEAATAVAERLRVTLANTQLPIVGGGLPLQFSVSIGVASLNSRDDNIDTLLSLADKALYQAKESGRNKVCVALQ